MCLMGAVDDATGVDQVLGDRVPDAQSVKQVPFLNAVIEEAMRLFPPVPFIARRAKENDTVTGYPVRKGELVFVAPWLTHRHPDLWPDPLTFKPERSEFGGTRSWSEFGVVVSTNVPSPSGAPRLRQVLRVIVARSAINVENECAGVPSSSSRLCTFWSVLSERLAGATGSRHSRTRRPGCCKGYALPEYAAQLAKWPVGVARARCSGR
jgi:hypothetical protein